MIEGEPPQSLTFYRLGCELCDRGELEAGTVLLERARALAQRSAGDSFNHSLLAQIDQRMKLKAEGS